jgi:hypothetical protein
MHFLVTSVPKSGVGTSHMSDIRQTSVANQRLVDCIFVVTSKHNNKGTVGTSHMSDIRQKSVDKQRYVNRISMVTNKYK